MAICETRDQVRTVAEEIRLYLSKHPESADTLEGVANWWLLRHRVESAIEVVSNALNYLIETGFVEKLEGHGHRIIYRRVPPTLPPTESKTLGDAKSTQEAKAISHQTTGRKMS